MIGTVSSVATPMGVTLGEPIAQPKNRISRFAEQILLSSKQALKHLPRTFAHLCLGASLISWSVAFSTANASLALTSYGLLATASAIYILLFRQKSHLQQSLVDAAELSFESHQLKAVLLQDIAKNHDLALSKFLTKWKEHTVGKQFTRELSDIADKIKASLQSIDVFRQAPIDMSQSIATSNDLLNSYMKQCTNEILPRMLTKISEYRECSRKSAGECL